MAGFSLGLLLGPTIGGALYTRFGYHGPFIFGIICAAVDLSFRLLIVERKDALKWGVDPCADPSAPSTEDPEQNSEQKTATLNTGIPVEGGTVVEDGTDQAKHTSFLKVVLRMGRSPRAQAALFLTALEAFVLSAQEPAITLHVADIWGLNPTQVGLVFLAFSIPAMISAPISGWLCDVRGAEWVTAIGLLLAIPWETLIILESSLVLFLVSLAIGSFFISSSMSPLMSELAAVSRTIDGVGYAHVYGAFNLIYGVGSAIGPVLGGQMYDHINKGWMAICLLSVGMITLAILITFFSTGNVPLAAKLRRLRAKKADKEATSTSS
jgi:MFS family permease